MGGTIHFNSCVTGIGRDDTGQVTSVTINGTEQVPAEVVIMGIGHSARDTYHMLYQQGIHMERKDFAVGVRIEHTQDLIDHSQYG